jgi:RHS repeat-associated protein
VSFSVNGLGQRVKKVAGGTTTYFAYDSQGHLIGEYDGSGVAIREVVWLGDQPISLLKPNGGSTAFFYVHTDHLNTPRLIANQSSQSVWFWDFTDPFGAQSPDENPSSLGVFTFNHRFPGQYYDVETGNHYNYFRDYDPSIGRYIESDPVGLKGGLNTYAYVRSRPLTLTDQFGEYDSRMRGFPGNDPYPACAGNDSACRAGLPKPKCSKLTCDMPKLQQCISAVSGENDACARCRASGGQSFYDCRKCEGSAAAVGACYTIHCNFEDCPCS